MLRAGVQIFRRGQFLKVPFGQITQSVSEQLQMMFPLKFLVQDETAKLGGSDYLRP